ncbi:MAG: hypothetical protein L0J17_00170 [Brevibacterium sp.]|nr:hypothetical protein [Brevibacterium sp.]MDN5908008.1 hypothetical protein [Brevibacterium sp.]MDN6173810.1 hypothetical protein [Brevibacterium sp.]MDN6188174.1 hypothetical protein [Brevibacterium sp.]MDN6191054.1 hypothetical protein [Brevibacterium sp.]
MKSIPRLVAGTAVVLAAVLTTAPVTAGIADFVLNPGQQPVKRAAPALTGSTTSPLAPSRVREDDRAGGDERAGDQNRESNHAANAQSHTETTPDGGLDFANATALSESAGLVAHTVADAQSRVTDLAGDLQAGVAAGEFSQADADRVLGDISSYIRGERIWPEQTAT